MEARDLILQADAIARKKGMTQAQWSLINFYALLYICFITHTHICIEGKTGIGKTACARAFSEILKNKKHCIDNYRVFSFHNGTNPNDFYGSLTLDEYKNITFCNGALTESILSKNIFIADELNLTSEETMNSLGPVLEENFGYKIYIPGLNNRQKINNKFLFISCQNLTNTLGRKQLTDLLKTRIKKIAYPEQNQNLMINGISDFEKICIDINISLTGKMPNNINNDNNNNKINNWEAKKLCQFILKFNEKNEGLIYNLNFRDVKKILKRIYFQKDNVEGSFIGFNMYNNILFYILAQTKEKDKNKMSKYLIPLLAEIFNDENNDNINNNEFLYPYYPNSKISDKIKEELENCFYSETKFIEKDGIIFLSKGKCGINVNSILTDSDKKNIREYNQLDTFLESFFLAKLALNDEPLLILGDTGYKTYLAEKLLNNRSNIINLNSETKLNYLLGSSIFLSKREGGKFYLKNYLNILLDDYRKESKYNYYKRKINKDGKILDENVINNLKEELNNEDSIKYKICIKLLDKLTIYSDNKENLILENIILEYNPGLITYAYLGKENLILKNFSYLDTSIIERFNEFFSELQIITLNEDIHKTFTGENDKVLKLDHIRIIATSYSELENKISEAIASRFTIIEVNSYKEQEENIMLQLYSKENNLKIKKEDLSIIDDFSFHFKNTFGYKIYLSQKLNIITILYHIINEKQIINTKIVLFMLMKNSFAIKSKEKLNKLKEILNERFIDYKDGESPFEIKDNAKLYSKITKLNIEINNKNNNDLLNNNDIYFHKNFSELVDIIHFSIKTKIGLIIEGMKGQGKKTAINYVANLLGYDILNIYLNESTKIEDILGSISFENENNEFKMVNVQTDFIKTIENKSKYNIIIFHNINKANLSILEQISNFYRKKNDIYNTNLNKIEPKYNCNFFISIFNYENSIRGKDYLPQTLIQNSIYFYMENNAIIYLKEIVSNKLRNYAFKMEYEIFSKSFLLVNKFDKEELKESNDTILSLNEIDKFIKLRKETFQKLDINIILGFIFIFRYSNNKIQEKVKNILKFGNFNSSLKIYYDSENIIIETLMNKQYNYISLPLNQKEENRINIIDINKKIVSLTGSQRYCLLFLVCCYLSNKPCILQGGTSSGKTYLIHLFANMLGKKLKI